MKGVSLRLCRVTASSKLQMADTITPPERVFRSEDYEGEGLKYPDTILLNETKEIESKISHIKAKLFDLISTQILATIVFYLIYYTYI